MARLTGTVSRGVRAPIIREGDNLAKIVVDSVLDAAAAESFALNERDVVAVTEAVVARAQGNYATVDQIAADVRRKFPGKEAGVVFPILSRNRFVIVLKGIARALDSMVLQLSYPSDEVGNALVSLDDLDKRGINPYTDVLEEELYREYFGVNLHPYTGIDYISLYREIVEAENCRVKIVLANDPRAILSYSDKVLACDIHSRNRTCRLLKASGATAVYNLAEVLSEPVDGSGYNPEYGLLGCNRATEEKVKLFPRDCKSFVEDVQRELYSRTGKKMEVMVYGDGAFRDPIGQIWELADPVVSPAFTAGLAGVPHEVKLKYLADNEFAGLSGQELNDAIRTFIAENKSEKTDAKVALGTTPRRLTDLLGSLSDLTSGSGDKGTPIVLIQGYFDNLAD